MRRLWTAIPLLLFLIVAGGAGLFLHKGERQETETLRPAIVPDFAVEGLRKEDLGEETALVNFFASWCIPCAAEHPALTALAKSMPVYGVNFMDKPGDLAAYLGRRGVEKVRTLLARDDTLVLAFFRSQGMTAAPFIALEREL